jgi:hypothetical protein
MAHPNQVTTEFTLARTSLIIGAYAFAKRMRAHTPLTLVRDPGSKVNPNDVMVVLTTPADGKNHKIGYLPLQLADVIGPLMDKGVKVIARKSAIPIYGVCQLAYLKPDPEPVVEPAPEIVPVEQAAVPEPTGDPVGATGATGATGTPWTEIISPLTQEASNDEPTPQDDGDPSEGI